MNEREIFIEALEHADPDRRCQFLDQACAGDDDLRQRVEALLRKHDQAGSFLNHPPVNELLTELTDPGSESDASHGSAATAEEISLDFLEPAQQSDGIGRLGQYEILEAVGRGGMGIVLKAQDAKLNRVVAVKVLAPELAPNPTARKRFSREAQAAAAVSHDHVVRIYAVHESQPSDAGDLPYLVMEFIDGQSLQQKIDQQGPLELKELLRIGRQIAAGLSAAHDQGLIHRDVKPSNVLLQNGVQRVQITDFGLARAVDDVGITRTGEVTGTPQYMSPEQAQGQPVDGRSDLFSLGSVLYAMCTGRSPFRADTSVAALRRVCDETPRPIREVNPDVPEWLIAVIDKLLAKDPGDRFQSAAEVSRLLEQYLAHLQQPSAVPEPPRPISVKPRSGRTRRAIGFLRMPAVVALLLIVGISLTDAAGLTEVTSTVIRIVRGDGTLVVRVNDPDISVSIDGDELVITGAGVQEIRLTPGEHEVQYLKNGEPVHQQLVSIERGGRQVVEVNLEPVVKAASSEDQDAQHERVWSHRGLRDVMSISPDGRYVAFRDTETRDLAIHDLTTGDDRRLTSNGPDGEEFTTEAVFSRDGEWVAYNWSNSDHYEGESGLHIIRIDGTETRQVLPQQATRWVQPRGWTPDGREILCRIKGENATQIAFVAVADGAIRVVKTLDIVIDQHPILALSPDGQTIAYEIPVGEDHRDPSNVYLLSADGSREFLVWLGSNDSIDDSILGWTPNGERLLVRSKRYDLDAAWLIRVVDGKPSGRRTLLWEGLLDHQRPGQFTADGAFYYHVRGIGRPDELWVLRNSLSAHEALDARPEPEHHAVWFDPQLVVELFSISPDETVLAFRDDNTGDLAVRNLTNGTVRRLTGNAVPWEAYPDNVRVSPDGRFIACEWRSEHGTKTDLRVFGVDGGEPRVLYTPDGVDVLQARPQDWSPDGQRLLVRLTNDDVTNGTTRIALMSVADGTVQVLKQPSYRWQNNDGCGLRFSPDGRYVAYEFQPEEGGTDIAVMSLDGTHDSVLIENWANDEVIDWTPDGNALLFGSDRRVNGAPGYARRAWLIDVADGRPQGEARMIDGSEGIGEYGEFAADGSLYHAMPSVNFVQDVYIARIDPESGASLEEPARASQRFPAVTRSAAWSPDGRFLAYYANVAEIPDSIELPPKQIVIRSTETGDEREIMLPNVYRGRGAWAMFGGEMLRWSPDGSSLLLDGFDRGIDRQPIPWGIYRLDVQTGEVTTVDTAVRGNMHLWQHGWSADGAEVVLRRALRDETIVSQQYLRRNLQSGATMEIFQQYLDRSSRRHGLMIDGAVSPDGSRLALLHQTDDLLSVLSVPMAGGEPKLLFETTGQGYNTVIAGRCLAWTPDGSDLIFSRQTRRPVSLRRVPRLQELWRIPVEGGEPEPLEFAASGMLNLDIHPDGRRIAYTRLQHVNELRVTEIQREGDRQP